MLGLGPRPRERQGLAYEATWHCHPDTMLFWPSGYASRHIQLWSNWLLTNSKHNRMRIKCDHKIGQAVKDVLRPRSAPQADHVSQHCHKMVTLILLYSWHNWTCRGHLPFIFYSAVAKCHKPGGSDNTGVLYAVLRGRRPTIEVSAELQSFLESLWENLRLWPPSF